MSAFALDPTYDDFLIVGGNLSLVTGAAETAQALESELEMTKGSWFLDTQQGTPWFQAVLVKNPSVPALTAMLRGIVLATPGVKSIISLVVAQDKPNRKLTWTLAVRHDSGAVITGGRGQPFIVQNQGIAA